MADPPVEGWSERNQKIAKERGYADWEDWIRQEEERVGHTICGARTTTTDNAKPCGKRPVVSRTRCAMHGGKSLQGASSATFVYGKTSPYVPKHLLDDFHEALRDPEYLSLRQQIAINETRQRELLRQLSSGESPAGWQDLRRITSQLSDAVVSQDMEAVMALAAKLDAVVDEAVETEDHWTRLRIEQEHGRRLKETESKIKKDREYTLDKDRALALIMWVLGILKTRVTDPLVLHQVSNDIRTAISRHEIVAGE